MSMTLEEAIKLLKQYQGYEPMFPDGETLKHAFDLTDETVDTLLTALRPVSREQVEKVWCLDMSDNKALTLEQLREMGGQPVYMPDTNCWALVTQNAFCPILTFPDGEKCSVYDWYEQVGPVYRRPPEGEEAGNG